MKLKKEIREAKSLVTNGTRGINNLIGTLRQIDYADTSERNMLVIDGLVRSLAYMNACKNQGLYFLYELARLKKIIHDGKKKTDIKIRKLKAQREHIPETYPPTEFMIVSTKE